MSPAQGPRFFPDGGTFRAAFSVRITVPASESPTQTLIYTTDGTLPRMGSEICESTLTIKPEMVAADPSNFFLRVCTFDPLSTHPFGTVRSSLPYHFSDDDKDEQGASSLNEQKEQPASKAGLLPSDMIQPTAQPWRDMPTPSWMLGPQWSPLDVGGGNEETMALLHGISQASRRKGGAHEDMDVMIPHILQLMMHMDREVRMAACEAIVTLGATNVQIHEGKPPPNRKAVSRRQRRNSALGGSQIGFEVPPPVNTASQPGSPLASMRTLSMSRSGSGGVRGNLSPIGAALSPQNARMAMMSGFIGGTLIEKERGKMGGSGAFGGTMLMGGHRGSFALSQYREEEGGQQAHPAVRLGSEVDVLHEVNMLTMHERGEVRACAATTLGRLAPVGHIPTIETLFRGMFDSHSYAMEACVKSLRGMMKPHQRDIVLQELISVIKSPSAPQVNREVVAKMVVDMFQTTRAAILLAVCLELQDANIRKVARQVITAIVPEIQDDDGGPWPSLVDIARRIQSSSFIARKAAVATLVDIAEGAWKRGEDKDVELGYLVLQALALQLEHHRYYARDSALEAMIRLAHGIPGARIAVIEHVSLRLEHNDPEIRDAASRALTSLSSFSSGHPKSKPCSKSDLIVSAARRTAHADPGVRKSAFEALERLNDGHAATDVSSLPPEDVGFGATGGSARKEQGEMWKDRKDAFGMDLYMGKLEKGAPFGGPDHMNNFENLKLADPEDNRRLWVSERRVGCVTSGQAAAEVDAPWANKDSRKLIAEVGERLESTNASVRSEASDALVNMIRHLEPVGGSSTCFEDVTTCIAKRLGHEDSVVRTCALEAFKDPAFRDKCQVTSTLLRHLEESPDGEPATRTNIIHALHFTSTPGDKDVLRALSRYINDEHFTVERAALDAADKIGRF